MTTEKERMEESIREACEAWANVNLGSGGSPAGTGGYYTAIGLLASAIYTAKIRRLEM